MVLDRVISSSWQKFGYFCPSISHSLMSLDDKHIFIICPFFFFDVRIQVVMPSLSTLFSNSSWEWVSNSRPTPSSILQDHISENLVFFMSPRTFDESGFSTLTHLCEHWTSDLLAKQLDTNFQFFDPFFFTNPWSFSSWCVMNHTYIFLSPKLLKITRNFLCTSCCSCA